MSIALVGPLNRIAGVMEKGMLESYALVTARERVRNFVLGLNGAIDSPLLENYLQDTGNKSGWNAVLTTRSDVDMIAELALPFDAVIASQTAMDAVAASQTAMDVVAASQTAMDVVAASQTAMDVVAASQTAMDVVAASQTAMDAVAASQVAMDATRVSSTAMQSLRSSILVQEASRTLTGSNNFFTISGASDQVSIIVDYKRSLSWSGATTEIRTLYPQGGVWNDGLDISSDWRPAGYATSFFEMRYTGSPGGTRTESVRYIPTTITNP